MTEFKHFKDRKREQQSFDKENIFIEKAGKKYNIYDMIQEARTDTEIYPTLEKYGCLDKIIINEQDVYADLRNAMDLRNIYDQQREAERLWYELPLEVRKDFDHDPKKFSENGLEYFKKKAEEKAKEQEKQTQLNNMETQNE